jgi:hypothetical protein
MHVFYRGSAILLALAVLPGSARTDTQPVSSKDDVARLPAAARQLYADTTLFPREARYERIPWLLDLEEGIRVAKEEKRPVLIWTSGDDPLERC